MEQVIGMAYMVLAYVTNGCAWRGAYVAQLSRSHRKIGVIS